MKLRSGQCTSSCQASKIYVLTGLTLCTISPAVDFGKPPQIFDDQIRSPGIEASLPTGVCTSNKGPGIQF